MPSGHPAGPPPSEVVRSEAAQAEAARAARDGYGRLLALLAAASGDIPAAEDALADAFERALKTWPTDGIPRSPEGWLLTVARNRLKDHWKSAATRTGVPLDPARHDVLHLDDIDPDAVGDRRLELMLVCAHPAIDHAARTPLMLNTVLGFTAAQIGGALAVPAKTLAARLVRAKRRIKDARIPFAIPDRSALPGRLTHVLEAVYGAHTIDWPIGGREERPAMAGEALHLAETLAGLLPRDGEVHGLAALICLSSARAPARVDGQGHLVPLGEQDPMQWDADLIARGHAHLRAAHASRVLGRFGLEAAIQAVHCARRESGRTDWGSLLELHRSLHALAPSLGSSTALAAVAAEVDGPAAGLSLLEELIEPDARFQPAWATRAHLLERLGRVTEADAAYAKAVSLTTDPVDRDHLERRRAQLLSARDQPGGG
ncbi:RNA polymerase sigma factor [Ornithinimicrobium faecis]|uniref:RNA polymerase sigma factor n=1 Tax=Ornithinimicrobium faecis TaxID=2934158 RepID=UPI002118B27C|nr:DUF6596 domain-containing protein [Ornithinimicrobium sp. HY1745]